jgi:hypothetical protein
MFAMARWMPSKSLTDKLTSAAISWGRCSTTKLQFLSEMPSSSIWFFAASRRTDRQASADSLAGHFWSLLHFLLRK